MYYPPASLIATGIIFALICVAVTSLRWWVRLSYCRAPIGLDDTIIVVGAVLVCGLNAMQIVNTIRGQASANTDVVKTAYVAHKIDYAQVIIEKVAYGSIKLSLLFFYRRIFGRWPTFRTINNGMIVVITTWMVVYLLGEILECGIHPRVLWDNHPAADYMCMDHGAFLVSFAATDVVTDIMVLSTPFPCVKRLQMSSRQRWAVSGVFLMGFLSTLAGVIRLAFLAVCYSVGQFTYNPPPLPDPPKVMRVINPIFWTNVELTCGVIAANLPPLWPLIRDIPKVGKALKRACRRLFPSSSESKVSSRVESTTMSQDVHEKTMFTSNVRVSKE